MMLTIREFVRRSDMLLIALAVVFSCLLYTYYGAGEPCIYALSSPQSMLTEAPDGGSAEPAATPPGKQPARAGTPVRFLMYNVRDYFVDKDPQRSRHTRRLKPREQREAVAKVISSVAPEVVGLVEIGGPAALDDLAERLADKGLYYPHKKVLTRWGEDRALGILSKHPIVEDHSVADCLLVGRTNRSMLRGILDVTIRPEEDKREFRIIGAHLKSRVSDDPAAAEALRSREARTLAEHIARAVKKSPTTPILVYGDWNDGPKSPALGVLSRGSTSASALHRLSPKDSNGETWTIYYKDGNEYNTFDQIYVNSVLSKRMGKKSKMGIVTDPADTKPSDHRAVWCDMY